MDRPFSIVHEPLTSTPNQHRDSLGVLASFDKYHLVICDLSLLHKLRFSEVSGSQIVKVASYLSSGGLDEFLHIRLLDTSHRENAFFGEVVLSHIVNAFLAEENVCPGFRDFFDH